MWWRSQRDRRHGILLDHPIDGDVRCESCDAACCRGFPSVELTWDEFELLHALGARRLHLPLAGPPLLLIDYCCEFLDNGRCAIYENRPEICKRFTCTEADR